MQPSLPITWIVCEILRRGFQIDIALVQGIDALMAALGVFAGGVIVISHDERFLTTVSKEVSTHTWGVSRPLLKASTVMGVR